MLSNDSPDAIYSRGETAETLVVKSFEVLKSAVCPLIKSHALSSLTMDDGSSELNERERKLLFRKQKKKKREIENFLMYH